MKLTEYPLFAYHTSLKETSKDPSNLQYMTESPYDVIRFDHVKEHYAEDSFHKPRESLTSADALMEVSPRGAEAPFVFVEFKNGKLHEKDLRSLREKLRDSLLIFADITNSTIAAARSTLDYIVVYNAEKNPPAPGEAPLKDAGIPESPSRLKIASRLAEKAHKELIRFDLERFQSIYYRNIHTYNETQFEDYLSKHGIPTEPCASGSVVGAGNPQPFGSE